MLEKGRLKFVYVSVRSAFREHRTGTHGLIDFADKTLKALHDAATTFPPRTGIDIAAGAPISYAGGGPAILYRNGISLVTVPNAPGTYPVDSLTLIRPPIGACAFTIMASTQSLPATGGSGSITFATTPSCAWTASSDATWLTLSAQFGTGNGVISFTASANPAAGARTAKITLNNQKFLVTQKGSALIYSGSFNVAGDFSRPPPPDIGTTCVWHQVFSGNIDLSISTQSDDSYSGTTHVAGTWTSTNVSGSTPTSTCFNGSRTWDETVTISGNSNSMSWETHFVTGGGSNVTGQFFGNFSASAATGTLTFTQDLSNGSASGSVTLPKSP